MGQPHQPDEAVVEKPDGARPPLGIGMVGYAFMGAAHSQGWRTVGRVFDLPRHPVLAAVCGRDGLRRGCAATPFWTSITVCATSPPMGSCLIRSRRREREERPSFRAEVGHRVADHFQVLVERRAQDGSERNSRSGCRASCPSDMVLESSVLCTIDRNGSYPSACSAVPLAPNKLSHTNPLEEVGKDRAGAFLITVPAWNHREMPHSLGRLAERTDETGRVWVTTPHVRQLQKFIKNGFITEPLIVHDSFTGKANESLFKPFYEKARQARAELVQAGGEPYTEYKRRLSIALRLLWPKGEKVNSPFWRPDWRIAMVAEAAVRHWSVAHRAVQAGAVLVALRNVDEAVFWTPDGSAPATYKVGTGFGEVKVKTGAARSER